MFRMLALGLIMGAMATPAAALVEALEVEHARMNARAGGPVSDYDAWLLERYGCYADTPHPVCKGGEEWRRAKKPASRYKRKRRD